MRPRKARCILASYHPALLGPGFSCGRYVVALTLLVASDVTVWLTLAFPVWVLIVSVLALSKAGLIDLHRDGD